MANLIRVKGNANILNMNEIDVHPEEKIEDIIYQTKGILSDIYILRRQVQNYANSERIDLIGVDNDNNIVIIEIKDEQVD